MMIHYLQHVPFEGPAHLAVTAVKYGTNINSTMLFEGQSFPDLAGFELLVIMGGPMGALDDNAFPWLAEEKRFIERSIKYGKRIIGICLGAQLLADVLGARVYRNSEREIGWFPVQKSSAAGSTRLGGVFPDEFYAFHWHGDTFDIPAGAVHLGSSTACLNQGFVFDDRVLALQFHIEATAESICQLLNNCRDELDGGKFVQNEREITGICHVDGCNALFEMVVREMLDDRSNG